MKFAPVVWVNRAEVPQSEETTAGVELLIVTPVGRLSVIEKFVRSVSLGAVISILNLELPPAGIFEGENDFIPETSVPLTVTLALTGDRRPIP